MKQAFMDLTEPVRKYTSRMANVLSNSASQGAEMYGSASQPAPPEVVKGVLDFTPIIGDALSAHDAWDAAKQGNYGEAALNAVGVLPGIPSLGKAASIAPLMMGAIKKGGGKGIDEVFDLAKRKKALEIAQKNAALPVEKGGLGLHPNNTPLERADAMSEFSMKLFRGFDPQSPKGNWYGKTPEMAFQNKKAMMEFRGPVDRMITGGDGKTYGARFTDDVTSLLLESKDKTISNAGALLKKEAGGTPLSHGEMIDFLTRHISPYGREVGEEAALDIFNKVAGTKGFHGGDAVLLHPKTPIRFKTAAFDPLRRGEADPLASVLLGLPLSSLAVASFLDTPHHD